MPSNASLRPHTLRGLFLFLSLLCAAPATAQAWTMPRGDVYAKLTYGHVSAAEQYTFDGRTAPYFMGVDADAFRDRSLYLYTEAGLTDDVTLVLMLPYKRMFVEDGAFRYRTYAFGTASVGARLNLLSLLGGEASGNALALNAAVLLPTGYTRNYTPSAGAGQVDAQAALGYGRSFWPLPAYAQAGVGYRHRTTAYGLSRAVACQEGRDLDCIMDRRPAYGDEFFFSFEAGATPFGGGVLAQVLVNGVRSLETPTVGFSALNPLPTRQRYLKAGGGLTLYPFKLAGAGRLEPLGLSVLYLVTPDGRNTIRSRDAYLGVEYRVSMK